MADQQRDINMIKGRQQVLKVGDGQREDLRRDENGGEQQRPSTAAKIAPLRPLAGASQRQRSTYNGATFEKVDERRGMAQSTRSPRGAAATKR